MTPERLRAYVLIGVRDILIPVGGVVLTFILFLTDRFEYWHLPLIAGMLGVPLVAHGGDPPKREDPAGLPEPPRPASQEES